MAFTENFSRGAYPETLETSANWAKVGGSATLNCVTGGLCDTSTAGTDALFTCPDQGNADHYSQIDKIDTVDNFGFMVVVRASDELNFIGARYNSGQVQLYKVVAGAFTSLGTPYTYTWVANDTIKLEAIGNNLTVYVNAVSRVTATDAFNNTITTQGIVPRSVATKATYDNFEAAAITSGPSITGEPAVVRPSGTGYTLTGTFPNTGTSTATVVMNGTTSVSCTLISVTATTVTFDMPAAPASLFDATGFTFTFTDDDSNAGSSAVVPYDPPTTHDFITLTSIAGTDADFTFGYAGATVASGKQVVYETPTLEDSLAIVVSADCSFTLGSPLTQNNTSDYYVIDADGTIGVTDTNTFLFSAGGAGGGDAMPSNGIIFFEMNEE